MENRPTKQEQMKGNRTTSVLQHRIISRSDEDEDDKPHQKQWSEKETKSVMQDADMEEVRVPANQRTPQLHTCLSKRADTIGNKKASMVTSLCLSVAGCHL